MSSVVTETKCKHCQLEIPQTLQLQGFLFCCQGCESVHRLLHATGLQDYYQIKAKSLQVRSSQAAQSFEKDFDYLDNPEFTPVTNTADGHKQLEFYIEGAHCTACVWLIEKLPELVPHVTDTRFNLGTAIASVTVDAQGSFAALAKTLVDFGYQPHAIKNHQEAEALQQRENHQALTRIGVAAFSAGNLMILAVALYAGVDGGLARYFEWLSLFLALPTLTYSAYPFYRNAWHKLRQKSLSIDVPIAVSLVVGLFSGLISTIWGTGENYFDSLCTLVCLLLLSRYFLARLHQQALAQNQFLQFYQSNIIRLFQPDLQVFKSVPLSHVQVGDWVEILPEERFPVDGQVLEGSSAIDLSILTGESYPAEINPGHLVYCGTRNLQQRLLIQVTAIGDNTKIADILRRTQKNLLNKTRLVTLTDRLAKNFVFLVLTASTLLFAFWLPIDPMVAFSRALALVIVSCPCALALATPLMMSISLKKAFTKGYLIKNADSLERLAEAQSIVFDKTGTLTEGAFEVLSTNGFTPAIQSAVLTLESFSIHPVADALVQYCRNQEPAAPIPIKDFKTLPTGGVQAWIEDHLWAVIPASNAPGSLDYHQPVTQILVCRDGKEVAQALLGDRVRTDAAQTIEQLRQMHLKIAMLSGDQAVACRQVGQAVGLSPDQIFWSKTPEQKEHILKCFDLPVMVGDGVNDVIALSAARVGISVQGGVAENLQTADIHLPEGGMSQLPNLVVHARKTLFWVKMCLICSFLYNMLSITAAAMGWISPLFAAVLMPVSSLTVLGISTWGGKRL